MIRGVIEDACLPDTVDLDRPAVVPKHDVHSSLPAVEVVPRDCRGARRGGRHAVNKLKLLVPFDPPKTSQPRDGLGTAAPIQFGTRDFAVGQ